VIFIKAEVLNASTLISEDTLICILFDVGAAGGNLINMEVSDLHRDLEADVLSILPA
jgi:hypothetical protein